MTLEFEQDDLDFSRAAASASAGRLGSGLRRPAQRAAAGLVRRVARARHRPRWRSRASPAPIIAAIFIPLFASLLIPLLAIWLNRVEDGVFQIETFELVNIIVGGLFAVIALNFTVNSIYRGAAAPATIR